MHRSISGGIDVRTRGGLVLGQHGTRRASAMFTSSSTVQGEQRQAVQVSKAQQPPMGNRNRDRQERKLDAHTASKQN